MKIMMGIPHKGMISTELANYVSSASLRIQEEGHKLIMIYNDNVPLDLARNQIVEIAKANMVDKLFFLDADVTSEDPKDVLKLCLSDKEVIAGIYPKRSFPIKHNTKIGGNRLTEFPDELFEVDTTGAGFLCIDMNVFKRMTKPYFNFNLTEEIDESPGEDEWFCNKVKDEAKSSVWIDPSIKCFHFGWHGFSFNDKEEII